tara:strand:- start:4935 stop:5141 length:207 start_codon:yes stop_codon:yes gene_type:complete
MKNTYFIGIILISSVALANEGTEPNSITPELVEESRQIEEKRQELVRKREEMAAKFRKMERKRFEDSN